MTTPRLLRWLRVVCIVAILLFGASAASALLEGRQRIGEATQRIDQQNDVRQLRISLLRAHDTMVQSFLFTAKPRTDRQLRGLAQLEVARQQTIRIAESHPDRAALMQLTAAIGGYTRTVQRGGDPTRDGASYRADLTEADTQLQNEILPILDSLVASTGHGVSDPSGYSGQGWVLAAAVAALAALLATMGVTARRFRRVLNPGLVAAMLLVIAGILTVSLSLGRIGSTLSATSREWVTVLQTTNEARAQAYRASTAEKLALILPEDAARWERSWSDAVRGARDAVYQVPNKAQHETLFKHLDDMEAKHVEIRKLTAGGALDKAREAARNPSPPSTARPFDDAAAGVASNATREAKSSLSLPRAGLALAVAASLAAALMAAGATGWGIRVRLKEYS